MKGLESFLSRVQQDTSNKVLVESFLHLLDGTSIELRFSYYYRLVKILAVHDRVYARNIYKKILTRHTGAQKKAASIADWVRKLEEIFNSETADFNLAEQDEPTKILSVGDSENTLILDPKKPVKNDKQIDAEDAKNNGLAAPVSPARPLELFVEKLNRANEGQNFFYDSNRDVQQPVEQRELVTISYRLLELINPGARKLSNRLKPWQNIISDADFTWLQSIKRKGIETYTFETHLQISAIFLQESCIAQAFALFETLSESKAHAFSLCTATAAYLQKQGLHYRVVKLWQGLTAQIEDINNAKIVYQSISSSWNALRISGFRWSPEEGIESLQKQLSLRLRPRIDGIFVGLK